VGVEERVQRHHAAEAVRQDRVARLLVLPRTPPVPLCELGRVRRLDAGDQPVESPDREAAAMDIFAVELHVAEEVVEDLPPERLRLRAQQGLDPERQLADLADGHDRPRGRLLLGRRARLLLLEAREEARGPVARRLADVGEVAAEDVRPPEVDEAEVLPARVRLAEEPLEPRGRRDRDPLELEPRPEVVRRRRKAAAALGVLLPGLSRREPEREPARCLPPPPRLREPVDDRKHRLVLPLLPDPVHHHHIPHPQHGTRYAVSRAQTAAGERLRALRCGPQVRTRRGYPPVRDPIDVLVLEAC